jgi:CheY-like chemotaxis protein
MDCQMPELDGLQATRMIREKGYSQAELPIIALTANVFDGDREACFESGMNDFITKPVVREKFLAVLTKWL